MKCKYCEKTAIKQLVWLKNRNREPARISLPWCGCDLMTALKRFWPNPYQVVEKVDYEIAAILEEFEGFVDRFEGDVAHITLKSSKEVFWAEFSVAKLKAKGIHEHRRFKLC